MEHDPPPRLHRNGLFWAGIASAVIAFPFAILALIGPAPGAESGEHAQCSLESTGGILQDAGEHPHYDQLKVELGETRTFPPATKCLLYGRNVRDNGAAPVSPGRYHLIASHFYPEAISYLWLLLIVFSPILLVLAVRFFRRFPRSR